MRIICLLAFAFGLLALTACGSGGGPSAPKSTEWVRSFPAVDAILDTVVPDRYGVFIAGEGTRGLSLLRLDSGGRNAWARRLRSSDGSRISLGSYRLTALADGSVLLSIILRPSGQDGRIELLCISRSGKLLWQRTLAGPPPGVVSHGLLASQASSGGRWHLAYFTDDGAAGSRLHIFELDERGTIKQGAAIDFGLHSSSQGGFIVPGNSGSDIVFDAKGSSLAILRLSSDLQPVWCSHFSEIGIDSLAVGFYAKSACAGSGAAALFVAGEQQYILPGVGIDISFKAVLLALDNAGELLYCRRVAASEGSLSFCSAAPAGGARLVGRLQHGSGASSQNGVWTGILALDGTLQSSFWRQPNGALPSLYGCASLDDQLLFAGDESAYTSPALADTAWQALALEFEELSATASHPAVVSAPAEALEVESQLTVEKLALDGPDSQFGNGAAASLKLP